MRSPFQDTSGSSRLKAPSRIHYTGEAVPRAMVRGAQGSTNPAGLAGCGTTRPWLKAEGRRLKGNGVFNDATVCPLSLQPSAFSQRGFFSNLLEPSALSNTTRRARPARSPEVVSLVERGWWGARRCSLVLAERGTPVTHLIRGWVDRSTLALIRPVPLVRLRRIPRQLFVLAAPLLLAWHRVAHRARWVLIDHERTLHRLSPWCRRLGLTPIALLETLQGYELRIEGTRVTPEQMGS